MRTGDTLIEFRTVVIVAQKNKWVLRRLNQCAMTSSCTFVALIIAFKFLSRKHGFSWRFGPGRDRPDVLVFTNRIRKRRYRLRLGQFVKSIFTSDTIELRRLSYIWVLSVSRALECAYAIQYWVILAPSCTDVSNSALWQISPRTAATALIIAVLRKRHHSHNTASSICWSSTYHHRRTGFE